MSSLDEDGLIAGLRRCLSGPGRVKVGIGDDAAVLAGGTVLSVDGYREGTHFDRRCLTPYEIGGRCACAALSDLVAMGARPDAVFVTLVLPPTITRRELTSLYRGIDSVCIELNCGVAGGDTIAGDRLLLALTVTGRTRRPLLRRTARPGEKLYLSGWPGAAETGRLLLARNPSASRRNPAVARHVLPLPRYRTMLALRRRIGALIDTSDGIAADVRRVARASGVRVVIEPDRLPVLNATRRLCHNTGRDLTDFVIDAGEDYELLFSSGSTVASQVAGVPVTRIGRIESGSGVWLETKSGRRRLRLRGYDHLRTAAHLEG